jgi:hypothetical protein
MGKLCDLCVHRPQKGYDYCTYAEIYMSRMFVPCCACFRREQDPVYNPPGYVESKDKDPYP